MKRFVWLVMAICMLGNPASAKDVCIQHVGTQLVLSKVKLPNAGAAVPLVGFFNAPYTPPLEGSITRLKNGELLVAATYYLLGATCFERVYVDETLSGSGVVECTSDLSDDLVVTWTRIDCKNVTIP